jgi:hypothetical protein
MYRPVANHVATTNEVGVKAGSAGNSTATFALRRAASADGTVDELDRT